MVVPPLTAISFDRLLSGKYTALNLLSGSAPRYGVRSQTQNHPYGQPVPTTGLTPCLRSSHTGPDHRCQGRPSVAKKKEEKPGPYPPDNYLPNETSRGHSTEVATVRPVR